jgi:TorA maturation chaperone TorD
MSIFERVRTERRHSECYRLFAEGFSAPEPDRWRRDRTFLELADALGAIDPDTNAAALAVALHRELAASDELALRVDHAALFVGPFALAAPPYGSVYLEERGALMGDTTRAAQAAYAAAGLTVTLPEPPDHVAVELEFMHYLADQERRAATRGDGGEAERLAGEERRFLIEHLGAWAPAFCAAVKQAARTRFYRLLAECLATFLAAERRRALHGL